MQRELALSIRLSLYRWWPGPPRHRLFVMDDLDLKGGTVGGDLVNWADDGRVAAEMAVRVLNGKEPENTLIVTSNHNYAF